MKLKIPGVTFSWKRALGITKIEQQNRTENLHPYYLTSIERKNGAVILNLLFKKK